MTSPFPTPFTVGWHAAVTPAGDDPETTYTPALLDDSDQPVNGTPVKVIGWAPAGSRGQSVEPEVGRVLWELDLYVPPGVVSQAADVVDIPLDRSFGRFEVVGMAEDFNHGPFGFTPGGVVRLKRVSG